VIVADPLKLLEATAASNHAVLTGHVGAETVYEVALPKASGAPARIFEIQISRLGSGVVVKEGRTGLLPRFCAERHINTDGSFCLFWKEADDLPITSVDDASRWWELLLAFLARQESAKALRKWPGTADARAHGDAARYQFAAEVAATAFGPNFVERLNQRRFSTRSRKHLGHTRIRLLQDGKMIAAVALAPSPKLMTLRSRCKCVQGLRHGRPIRSCADHAGELAKFIVSVERWRVAETEFYKIIKQKKLTCCATIDDCPLAA
jgi:hypothetical protein